MLNLAMHGPWLAENSSSLQLRTRSFNHSSKVVHVGDTRSKVQLTKIHQAYSPILLVRYWLVAVAALYSSADFSSVWAGLLEIYFCLQQFHQSVMPQIVPSVLPIIILDPR